MKQLEQKFKLHGWHFEQVTRSDSHAIYRKQRPDWDVDRWSYEVVRAMPSTGGTMRRGDSVITLEAKEHYPSSTVWGQRGWTYPDLSSARVKFNSLVEQEGE